MELFIRIGDGGEYQELESDIFDAVDLMKEYGVQGPFEKHDEYGIQCEGYRGQNYISLYWGNNVEDAIRGLNDAELDLLNRMYSNAKR